jgi:hypothetical protein
MCDPWRMMTEGIAKCDPAVRFVLPLNVCLRLLPQQNGCLSKATFNAFGPNGALMGVREASGHLL